MRPLGDRRPARASAPLFPGPWPLAPGPRPRFFPTGAFAMKAHLYVLTMFLGVVLAVHLSMNGKVGSVLNNARVGNALFWCLGAVGALAIGLTGWQSGALSPLRQVHPVL